MANTKYTKQVAAAIARHLAKGVPKKYAAAMAGVSYDALNDWLHGRGGIPDEDVNQFRQSISRAEAQGVATRIERIDKAGASGDWRADAWYLEHVHAETFAARQDHTHAGPDGEALTILLTPRQDGPQ